MMLNDHDDVDVFFEIYSTMQTRDMMYLLYVDVYKYYNS